MIHPNDRHAHNLHAILDLIRGHGSRNFTGTGIARELGLCRQTVYARIRQLRAMGHTIEGEAPYGFMAKLKKED